MLNTGTGNTLHFINRVDNSNCGDKVVCPLLYYYDYFKQYNIKRHDMRFIDFKSIADTDVVIIGGGGMLDYAEFTNRGINKVFDTGAAVIAWSPGFNTHTEYSETFETKICFDRFVAITVRDFTKNHGLEYLPDVTCKLPGLKEKYIIRREFGVATHKDYPIKGFKYDTITNECEIDEILQFIGESEIIISNSFHMIYWSTLMGKKTICANPFSSKFHTYKYKPEYFYSDTDILSKCVNQARMYNILDECIEANDAFFERVKGIIESRLKPISDDFVIYDYVTKEALVTQRLRETQLQDGDLLASQLFIDKGNGFTEDCKLISINNVYGDDIHSVRYILSNFDRINALRFDPVEGRNCEVEIISAKTATGNVTLVAQAAIRRGNWDRFLTTDPQYYIDSSCTEFIEIIFRLRALNLFEAEQNIYSYVERQSSKIKQQSEQIEQQSVQIEHQSTQIELQSLQIAHLSMQIGQQSLQIEQQSAQLEQQSLQIEQKLRQIERQSVQIEHQSVQIGQQSLQIERLYNSTWWKITAPVRTTTDFLRRFLKGIR